MKSSILNIFFDGGNEKGIATWAVVAKTSKNVVAKLTGLVDPSLPQTNNVAEWTALYMALTYAKSQSSYYDSIEIKGDSELIVKQINGEYACKHPNLIVLYQLSMNLYTTYNRNINVSWITRESNKEADELGRTLRNVN